MLVFVAALLKDLESRLSWFAFYDDASWIRLSNLIRFSDLPTPSLWREIKFEKLKASKLEEAQTAVLSDRYKFHFVGETDKLS